MEAFRVMGEAFGYPKCCIDEFIGFVEGKNKRESVRKLWGTGYVPCVECNKKTEKELIDFISQNRKHGQKFPKDDLY